MNETSDSASITPVGQLVLARLLVAGEKGATGSELRKALEPIIGHRWTGSPLIALINTTLDELAERGLVLVVRKGKTERGTLTAEGQRHALAVVGIDELPPRTTWDKVKKVYLPARALKVPVPVGPAAKNFGGEPGFKAALLRRQFDLPLGDFPAIQDALDALGWQLLGFEPGPKFTAKAVLAALILRTLGAPVKLTSKTDPKSEVTKLLGRQVGARQSGKDELRLAVLRQWVDAETETETEGIEKATSGDVHHASESYVRNGKPASLPTLDLPGFASRVVEAARASRSGRFGDDKVFVSHVWHALRDDASIGELGLDGFKRRLAEANNARLLNLTRADMVEAMDRDDVTLSEVAHLGATFHFIKI